MKVPLVSIGLPVYNGERFLAQALDSLLGQTLADFELIVSDNASTDRTAEICLAYATRDARVRYVRQETNIGALRNWNFVARQARGQYFKWASANDFCDPRLLEKCVALMSTDSSVVLCHGRTCLVDEATGERRACDGDISATDPRPSERFQRVARTLVVNNEVSGVMRLDILHRTPLMRPYEGGDLVLTIELSLYGRIVELPEILYYRRVGRQSSSMQLDRTHLQALLYAGSAPQRFERWRRRIDLVGAVLRAPLPPSEKLRTLLLAADRVSRKFPAEMQWLIRSTMRR
jgi:glycosyltransferase involved in cell wall biosynthesis